MELNDVTKDLKDLTEYRLQQRFDEMMRTNPRYNNLGPDNRKLIMDLIHKYKQKLIDHSYPSDYTISRDMYSIYEKRVALGLTRLDLDQIRALLQSFKR